METRDRAAGAVELRRPASSRGREADHRPVEAVLEARGDDADHALVPARVEAGRACTVVAAPRDERSRSASASSCIVASISRRSRLSRSSCSREVHRPRLVVGEQALDADRHVGEPPGGVEPRAGDEAEVVRCRARRGRGRRRANSASTPGCALPGAHPREALLDEDRGWSASRRTTSATVPSATRSSSDARFGSARAANAPCARSSRAQSRAARRTSRPRRRGACAGNAQPGWFGLTMHRGRRQRGPGR